MTLLLIVVWPASLAGAFIAGYMLRKPIEQTGDRVKETAKEKIHEAADAITNTVRDIEGKVSR